MGVNQVKFGDATVMDISDSTVAPETLLSGVTAYNKAGNKITGEVVVEHVEVDPVLETGTKSATITVGEEIADIYCENTKAEVKNMKTTQSATIANKIAQFECIDKNFVKALKLAMEPIQDLHGYDHPWVGGAGKNKINITDRDVTVAGVNIKVENGVITINGTSTGAINYHLVDNMNLAEQSYTFSLSGNLSGSDGMVAVQTSLGNRIASNAGNTFTASMTGFMWFFCSADKTFNNVVVKPMICLSTASEPTVFAPYENICPISGRTEASITSTGVNQWDGVWEGGDINVGVDGANHTNANRIRSKNYIQVAPNTRYYFQSQSYGNPIIAFYAKDKSYPYNTPNVGYKGGKGLVTTPEWCYYVRFYVNATSATYNEDVCLNYPSTDTAYHVYTAETYTRQYPDTIYKGTDDFIDGGGNSAYKLLDLGTINWRYDSQYERFVSAATVSDMKSKGARTMKLWCSHFKEISDGRPITQVPNNAIYTGSKYIDIHADQYGTDPIAFKTAMSGVQLCYELATPTTIQTTAEKIITLPGVNIISATEPISECSYRVLEENLSDTIYSNETLVGEDSDVYTFRTAPDISDANYVEENIVGGSVAFNQLIQNGNFEDTSNWTASYGSLSASNNKGTLTLTSQNTSSRIEQSVSFPSNHKFYISFDLQTDYASSLLIQLYGTTSSNIFAKVLSANTKTRCEYVFATSEDINTLRLYTNRNNVGVANNTAVFENICCCDLTAMFGSTVADYVYNLENTTAGSGIAFLKKYGFFTKDYYDYNTGSLQSVNFNKWFKTSKNLFNLNRMQGVNNIIDGNDIYVRLQKNTVQYFHDYNSYIPGNRTYTLQFDPSSDIALTYATLRCRLKDNSNFGNVGAIDGWTYQNITKNYHKSFENASHVEITATIPDCLYCEFGIGTNNNFENIKETGTYVKFSNIQLEVGPVATDYEPYEGYEISLDDDLDLRGLFRISDNKLVADGDIYEGDGKVTRKYAVVDMSSLTWSSFPDTSYGTLYYTDNLLATANHDPLAKEHLLCSVYNSIVNAGHDGRAGTASEQPDGSIRINVASRIYIRDESCATLEDFQTKISNAKLMYELEEPILNRGTNFDSPHVFIHNGNEYFVKTYTSTPDRDIDVPAGHVGKYYGKSMFKEISLPTIPKSGGTYTLKCNVLADGNKKLYWCVDGN